MDTRTSKPVESHLPGDKRRLGDEWRDWDGKSPQETRAGKRLFFSVAIGFILLIGGAGLFFWYLIAPRLAQWHPAVPRLVLWAELVLFVLLLIVMGMLAATLLFQYPLPRIFRIFAHRMLGNVEWGVFSLGHRLSISQDRLAHSFVKTHNTLIRMGSGKAPAEKILVLLPRCLLKEQIQQATALCAQYRVHVAVVAGGELARQRILERRPRVVIGVACERDLLSGIRDVHNKIDVLGIPNIRPNGPCKDTSINLDELRAAIKLYITSTAAVDTPVNGDSSLAAGC